MKQNSIHKTRFIILILICILMGLVLLGLGCGSVKIPLGNLLEILSSQDKTSQYAVILRTVRLPRVIAGLLAGCGLGCAGVILQGVLNNSLASPNTIGVNSGAGFLVMLSLIIFPQNLFAKSFMAFIGAFATSVVILMLAYIAEKSRITIVLAGITISSFLSAGINLLKILDTDIAINSTQFLIGTMAGVTMKSLFYPAIGIGFGVVLAILLFRALNIMALGDGVASSLGLRVNLFRMIFLLLASILAGFVVSFAGLVGFVGLIVPHICRYLFGHDNRILIPTSCLLGAISVLLSDLISRVLFAPYELPVGIILSLTGGPFFLYLLMKKGGRRVNA